MSKDKTKDSPNNLPEKLVEKAAQRGILAFGGSDGRIPEQIIIVGLCDMVASLEERIQNLEKIYEKRTK